MFPQIEQRQSSIEKYQPYPKCINHEIIYKKRNKDYISNLKKLRDYLCLEEKKNVIEN